MEYITANRMISGEVLKYLKREHLVIYQKYGPTAKPSNLSDNTQTPYEVLRDKLK